VATFSKSIDCFLAHEVMIVPVPSGGKKHAQLKDDNCLFHAIVWWLSEGWPESHAHKELRF
jgi:hypothetical protein